MADTPEDSRAATFAKKAYCMNATCIQLTLKISSRHALRHLERHIVCVFIEYNDY